MGTPYLGEIRMFGGNFAPSGWAFCNGQLLAISQYSALFNLIGTTYGGDGQSTFGLPDLQGRVPVHQGPNFTIGQLSGSETVTLTVQQIPVHSHLATCRTAGSDSPNPANTVWGAASDAQYAPGPPDTVMNAVALPSVGGSQPHDNMLPYLTVNFIISLFGVFPSQT